MALTLSAEDALERVLGDLTEEDFAMLAACPCGTFTKPRRLSRHFPPAPRIIFSRRLAARPWHRFGHFLSNPRVGGFSSRQVATVSDFHQALAPSWAFFAHCFGQRTCPRASACGIFTDGVWYSGTSEKLALTTSGGNDALSPALWKSPQRCVSVRRWVCAVLGPARHSLARV